MSTYHKWYKTPKNCDPHHASPGGYVSSPGNSRQSPKNWVRMMRRLAVGDKPPSGFWVKSRNLRKTAQMEGKFMQFRSYMA